MTLKGQAGAHGIRALHQGLRALPGNDFGARVTAPPIGSFPGGLPLHLSQSQQKGRHRLSQRPAEINLRGRHDDPHARGDPIRHRFDAVPDGSDVSVQAIQNHGADLSVEDRPAQLSQARPFRDVRAGAGE